MNSSVNAGRSELDMVVGYLFLSVEMKDFIIFVMMIVCGLRVRVYMDLYSGLLRLFLYLFIRLLISSSKFFTFSELTFFRIDFNMFCKVFVILRYCKLLKKVVIILVIFLMFLVSFIVVFLSFWIVFSV